MPLYQHRFSGHTASNETFMYTWWAQSIRSIGDAQTAALAWNALLWGGATAGNGYEDHVTLNIGVDNVTTVLIDPLTGLQTSRVDTAQNLDGVVVGVPMPADVSLVVSLRTALANRRGRGRFYLPQPATANLTSDGRVIADLITDLSSSLAAAWASYNTTNDRPVVYSRAARSVQNITSFNVGDLFDTQRRRENKLLEARTVTAMP
jgi:hypothetical protein